jgi:hypothetical protein
MSTLSNLLQAAGGSPVFWLLLAVVLGAALVGLLLFRRKDDRDLPSDAGVDNAKIIQDWVPTGRMDFAGPAADSEDADTPASYYLQAEETRVLLSVSGIERREIRWRRATLNEAKRVLSMFHRHLPGLPPVALKEAPPIAAAEAAHETVAKEAEPGKIERGPRAGVAAETGDPPQDRSPAPAADAADAAHEAAGQNASESAPTGATGAQRKRRVIGSQPSD